MDTGISPSPLIYTAFHKAQNLYEIIRYLKSTVEEFGSFLRLFYPTIWEVASHFYGIDHHRSPIVAKK